MKHNYIGEYNVQLKQNICKNKNFRFTQTINKILNV